MQVWQQQQQQVVQLKIFRLLWVDGVIYRVIQNHV